MTDISKISNGTNTYDIKDATARSGLSNKQDTLVSGTNIKTINNQSILGEGNITISGGESIPNQNVNPGAISPLKMWNGTEQQWTNGEATTWYCWQTNIVGGWTFGTLPATLGWGKVVYGNNIYVIGHSNKIYRSTDGVNWSSSITLPSGIYANLCFGNGKFVITTGKNLAYSTDGETWTVVANQFSILTNELSFTNGYFTSGGNPYAISTDGVNWTEVSTNVSLYKIIYANGVYVGYSDRYHQPGIYFSTDGVTFTLKQSSENEPLALTYFNDKFIWFDGISGYGCKVYYSTDGEVWTQVATFSDWEIGTVISCASSDLLLCSTPHNDRSGSGGDNHYIYTTDGINWSSSIINGFSTDDNITSIAYNGNNFFAVSGGRYKMAESDYMGSNVSLTYQLTFYKCYTDITNPITSSQVYSAPETQSALTISSVTSGAITLSDNNTYYYNQSGNAYSYQTVGDAHPDWLCNINNVGVKIGNTTIATVGPDTTNMQTTTNLVTSVSSSSTDTQYPSAKLFYDTCGDIESAINTIRGV